MSSDPSDTGVRTPAGDTAASAQDTDKTVATKKKTVATKKKTAAKVQTPSTGVASGEIEVQTTP